MIHSLKLITNDLIIHLFKLISNFLVLEALFSD
jgi:hypothetical protein